MGKVVVRNIPKEFNIALDLKRSISNTDFEVVEGDTENYINITLTDDGLPVSVIGNKIVAVFTHSKGSFIQSTDDAGSTITASGNVIRIHLRTGAFSVGMVECELRIYGNLVALSTTPVFNFNCRASLFTDETLEADDRFDVLTDLIGKTNSALDMAQKVTDEVYSLPLLDIVYSNVEPSNANLGDLSKTRGEYMGVFCERNIRPTDVSDYTWVHLAEPPHVTGARIDSSDELTFTLSNGTAISASGFASAIANKVASEVQKIPKIVDADIDGNGSLQFRLSDNSTLTVQNYSGFIESTVNSALNGIKPVTAKNIIVEPSAFATGNALRGYLYYARVPCAGMKPEYVASVVFSAEDAESGNFASVATAGTDCVYIYAKTVPQKNVTLLLVKGEK